jgi:PAS domain-containing protein
MGCLAKELDMTQPAEEIKRLQDSIDDLTAINVDLRREIAGRARTKLLAREADEQTRIILDSLTDKFFAVDKDWRYTYFNKPAEEQLTVLGKNPASLIGKVLWDEFPNPLSEDALRRAMLERAMTTDENYYPRSASGTRIESTRAPMGVLRYSKDTSPTANAPKNTCGAARRTWQRHSG